MDGMICNLMYWNDRVIEVEPPSHVNLKITYTETGPSRQHVGQHQQGRDGRNRAEIQVRRSSNREKPVRIDTRNGQYVERVRV